MGKVTIDHKGHIISVNEHALNAHLNHGDTIVSGPVTRNDVGTPGQVPQSPADGKKHGKKP